MLVERFRRPRWHSCGSGVLRAAAPGAGALAAAAPRPAGLRPASGAEIRNSPDVAAGALRRPECAGDGRSPQQEERTMHPEMIRAIAAQQIADRQAEARRGARPGSPGRPARRAGAARRLRPARGRSHSRLRGRPRSRPGRPGARPGRRPAAAATARRAAAAGTRPEARAAMTVPGPGAGPRALRRGPGGTQGADPEGPRGRTRRVRGRPRRGKRLPRAFRRRSPCGRPV